MSNQARDLESSLRAWLARLPTRTPYPRWYLHDAPCSLSRLGKYGDDFEGELVGRNENDPRVIVLVRDSAGTARVEVVSGGPHNVLATFLTLEALQNFLARDGRPRR